jgi:hypothetical protein
LVDEHLVTNLPDINTAGDISTYISKSLFL